MPVSEVTKCACGQPLHYSDPLLSAYMVGISAERGEFIKVQRFDGRAWMVQRHYIALHGIKAEDLGTPALPAFEEVAP